MLRMLMFSMVALFSMNAAAVQVVSSIKPIHLIVSEITADVAQSQTLLGQNTSPHDYALKPSDVRTLSKADLVVWFGQGLEPYLESVLEGKSNSFEIAQLDSVSLREFAHDHHDDGHDHGSTDPHFWLGVTQATKFAEALTQKLSELDPQNSAAYQANLSKFKQNLSETEQRIKTQLNGLTDKGYFVFHDAYGYFESHFGLTQLGHFTISPERKPGARTLIGIRTALKEESVSCVFKEPQFTPAVIESVTRGSDVGIGELDPLASTIEEKPGAYFDFLRSMSESFSSCLSAH